ncbi:MAG: serine/threonine protein kinase, partial [Planctomycetaceae bacterium]|nr:serine/threonine protein kinase [Planctomycetaceae bacterium]
MSDDDFIRGHDSAVDLHRRIDAICSQFERQWRDKQSPRIEEFLEQIPVAGRARGLRELIAVEVDLRRAAGDVFDLENYLPRFPEDEQVVHEAFALVDRRAVPDLRLDETASDVAEAEEDTDPQPNPVASPANDQLPKTLGRFQIEKELGKGSFGVVYLAKDPQLGGRHVALKVPRAERFETEGDRQEFILDAERAARLNHPGIVTIYDVVTEGDRLFIVQEYMPGGDLKQRFQGGGVTCPQAVAWMIPIAEAVAFAHQKDIFHRDLKPANILLDERGEPRVADFGLALHESEQLRHRHELAGSPAYMSPEQVRRESHRLDGRSDTWSLGVIFYEMLTGRRPFRGEGQDLFDQIKDHDPRPPRELKPDLPVELERICLKCLAKPVVQRYSTAADLAQDLRHWQQSLDREGAEQITRKKGPARVVPKGLRSFDARDADFFLDLLPGARDRDGLPESIRFWKVRIEETDPAETFAVGVLHGPSGCGKSSMLKAGLLPRLASHVTPVFVEATAADTEVRLLNGLRRQLPEIPRELSLPDVLAGFRAGRWNPHRKKILIVLDQFEQWLHAGNLLGPAQLVDALRHCDGEHLQCLVLVREDFWTGISRFMQRLEIPLQEQRNAALVDRFDPLHARRVLTEFGRAFGRLPDNLGELTPQQNKFLDAAIEQLSEEGRVICVRLALFGDLVKGKPWTQAALEQAGGAEGLGVTFLEDTFAAKPAPEAHRRHEKGVRKLFRKLLPEADSDIKGSMQPREALLEACGYAEQPRAFDELIKILDDELRLITPTDPEGNDEGGRMNDEREKSADSTFIPHPSSLRFFQFTHDYLVPSVRRWLNLKQAETAQGRAELRLAERAALWHCKRENRHLPSLWEFLKIRLLTEKKRWTEPQQKMMRKAGRVHITHSSLAALSLAIVAAVGMSIGGRIEEQREKDSASSLVQQLVSADIGLVPGIAKQIEGHRRWADPLLTQAFEDAETGSVAKLHAALALAPVDAAVIGHLRDRLLTATPAQFPIVRYSLEQHDPQHAQHIEDLWKTAADATIPIARRFQAACALATYTPKDARWPAVVPTVVQYLVELPAAELVVWREALRPARRQLQRVRSIQSHIFMRHLQLDDYESAREFGVALESERRTLHPELRSMCGSRPR